MIARDAPMVCATSNLKADPNLSTYNAPAIVEHYAALDYLTACEQLLFETYLKPGMAVLDLGVGGGRTTPYLSSIAAHYVGVDYAEEMIARCRDKFPHLEFEVSDAADLSKLASASFDSVVMAFNAMDYVIPDESRFRALREIARVLKPRGMLIFSSHNPRSIWVPPSWNPERIRDLARALVGVDSAFFWPLLWFLLAARVMVAWLQGVLKSVGRATERIAAPAFWRGQGYLTDPAHGGLTTHLATPKRVAQELAGFGFRQLCVLGDDYPLASRLYVTKWYYYVFSKNEATAEK